MSKVQWTGGIEHWTTKGDIKLFMWQKPAAKNVAFAGTLFFVHLLSPKLTLLKEFC